MKYTKTCLFLLLLGLSGISHAEDLTNKHQVEKQDLSWVPLLDKYLQTGQFGKARELANSQNSAAVIERIRPWAESGLTPAQWIYSEILDNSGFSQESAKWAYISFFNTRFDSHLCRNSEAPNLEKSIIMSFNKVVTKARINRDIMSEAINEAIVFLKDSNNSAYIEQKHPQWICYMLPNNTKDITISSEKWQDIYNNQLNSFIEITNSEPKKTDND